jgi:hypothetical protein
MIADTLLGGRNNGTPTEQTNQQQNGMLAAPGQASSYFKPQCQMQFQSFMSTHFQKDLFPKFFRMRRKQRVLNWKLSMGFRYVQEL